MCLLICGYNGMDNGQDADWYCKIDQHWNHGMFCVSYLPVWPSSMLVLEYQTSKKGRPSSVILASCLKYCRMSACFLHHLFYLELLLVSMEKVQIPVQRDVLQCLKLLVWLQQQLCDGLLTSIINYQVIPWDPGGDQFFLDRSGSRNCLGDLEVRQTDEVADALYNQRILCGAVTIATYLWKHQQLSSIEQNENKTEYSEGKVSWLKFPWCPPVQDKPISNEKDLWLLPWLSFKCAEHIVFEPQGFSQSWSSSVAQLGLFPSQGWSSELRVAHVVKALQFGDGRHVVRAEDIKVPWDPGGLLFFESAWGQAEFLEGKDVMDLLRGSKESWARLDVAQEAFSTICTKGEEETERPCRLTRSRTGQPAAASLRSRLA